MPNPLDLEKMLGDPTDAEVEQFMKEFDEGKHPLSDADKDALATGGFMRSLRAHTALKKAQAEIAALRAENERLKQFSVDTAAENAALLTEVCTLREIAGELGKACEAVDRDMGYDGVIKRKTVVQVQATLARWTEIENTK